MLTLSLIIAGICYLRRRYKARVARLKSSAPDRP
jgi:hypothetical protein